MGTNISNALDVISRVFLLIGCTFERQEPLAYLEGRGDANYAACPVTRKSTTGYTLHHGKHTLGTGPSTQSIISLSVGESEFYAAVKTACRVLGLQQLFRDLGIELPVRLGTDSSSAKGMASRRGAGGVRHIHTPALWLQQTVARRKLLSGKTPGDDNTADIGTKVLAAERMWALMDTQCLRKVSVSPLQLEAPLVH